jgi:pimeloyl-ACP methyl ester carboxylesterase
VAYRWHRLARIWRAKPAGELAMRTTRGGVVGLGLTEAHPTYGPMPRSLVVRVRETLRRADSRRAILALYRSAPTEVLDEIGSAIGSFTPPTLLLWAERDRYIGPKYGERLAAVLPDASLERLGDAGHWSWIDRPDAIDRAIEFLTSG